MGSIENAQKLFLCLCILVAAIGPSVSSKVASFYIECDGVCVLWCGIGS